MALKKLLWRKYLFVNRVEAETEQNYWNEKRKKHLAHEHSEGVVRDLGVTETDPPSLTVDVAAGRALDTEGNDPEVESPQDLDCAALLPSSGEVTVYITLRNNTLEAEPYFVDELGTTQNKFVQDSFVLEATTQAPAAPTLELARFRLAAGATAIRDAADPNNPGLNEIDSRQVKHSGREVLALGDLSDVDPAEADAFNGMENPSASNPITTVSKADSIVAPVRSEVVTARGTKPSLDARLDEMLNDDGSFKGITKITPAAPLTGGGVAGDIPIGIDDATPAARGAMSAADKAKLDGIEPGATGDQTAQEILDALRTVDGAGSELDADRLDGFDSADFAPILHKNRHVSGGPDAFSPTDLLDALVRRFLEAGGASLLLGAIEDGQFLKRSGGSLIGDVPQAAGISIQGLVKTDGDFMVGNTGVFVDAPGANSVVINNTSGAPKPYLIVVSGIASQDGGGTSLGMTVSIDGVDVTPGFNTGDNWKYGGAPALAGLASIENQGQGTTGITGFIGFTIPRTLSPGIHTIRIRVFRRTLFGPFNPLVFFANSNCPLHLTVLG